VDSRRPEASAAEVSSRRSPITATGIPNGPELARGPGSGCHWVVAACAGLDWLGDNSSITKKIIERLYALSGILNDKGQYLFYGRVAGCLITGNEDGIKHCAQNVLYSLQHLGYTIPPNADAGWIGEAGPGPSYLDPGSGGPDNDFTNRNTTFMTWNLMHLARMLKDAGGVPGYGNQRSEWNAGARFDFENPEYRA
jgi:hypothetical protein